MEKSETGGSDPYHPLANILLLRSGRGTLAPFLRALGLRTLDQNSRLRGGFSLRVLMTRILR